jgi:ribosomal-protein-alanine N-acetyltransferase
MAVEDIERVLEIDALAYPEPWHYKGYHYELTQSEVAHYHVLEVQPPTSQSPIIGFCGIWLIGGECHISTVAIDPAWQGNGLGELLFWHMQWQALEANVELTTLEVRASNTTAQALYAKYGLEVVGRRKRYYKANNAGIREDAILMTVTPLDHAYRQKMTHWRELLDNRVSKLRTDTPPAV